jgi:hypothetical protein
LTKLLIIARDHFKNAGGHCREWGRHIRSCRYSIPELIQALGNFSLAWDIFPEEDAVEFHDVVQWLKMTYLQTLPNPHSNCIARWQGYLLKSMALKGNNYSHNQLEKRWQANLGEKAIFHGPAQYSDKEIIRYWGSCLTELRDSRGGGGYV